MSQPPRVAVNNEIYHQLGERWYTAQDDPVALLRAEAALRNPWIAEQIRKQLGTNEVSVLDIGCGGGFLTNLLARSGFRVVGLDQSVESLAVARLYDTTGTVQYDQGDACRLPYPDQSFDVVCSMDFLEHVDDPKQVVAEAARMIKPGGMFFFSTFNRNPLSWLVVIKGVEWFVKNTPPHMHVYHLFLKPSELARFCLDCRFANPTFYGLRPSLNRAFFQMLVTRVVPPDFSFTFSNSLQTGYLGVAIKRS